MTTHGFSSPFGIRTEPWKFVELYRKNVAWLKRSTVFYLIGVPGGAWSETAPSPPSQTYKVGLPSYQLYTIMSIAFQPM